MNRKDVERLLSVNLRSRLKQNEPLWRYCTFKIGGEASVLLEVYSADELAEVVTALGTAEMPFLVVGAGSNLLFDDAGYDGVVVVATTEYQDCFEVSGSGLIVDATCALDSAVKASLASGLVGLEELSGIPGTVAGAVVGNAGAFGRSIGELVKAVEVVLPKTGEKFLLEASELEFAYRQSSLASSGLVLLRVWLNLTQGDSKRAEERRKQILELRRVKHPDPRILPTAGSFFKNIVKPDGSRESTGALLDRVGAKGMSVGDAFVYHKHANIIVNVGQAKAKDVIALAQRLQTLVRERFGVELEPEVRFVASSTRFGAPNWSKLL